MVYARDQGRGGDLVDQADMPPICPCLDLMHPARHTTCWIPPAHMETLMIVGHGDGLHTSGSSGGTGISFYILMKKNLEKNT